MNPIRYLCDAHRWLVDPYRLLDDALARHGPTFRIRLPVLGDVLMTGDPRLTAEIAHHKDLDGGIGVAALGALLGRRSLIVLQGEAHAARHRLIAPLFRGDSLHDYDEPTVRRTREVFERLPTGRTFSLYDVLRGVGLRVLVAAMFGDDGAAAGEAEEKVVRFLHSFRNPLVLFCRPLRVDAGSWSPWGRAVRNRRALCDFIRRQIRACDGAPGERTILQRLVAAGRSASLDEEDLIEEVLSLLLFGHDTAAATMAWAFVHILRDSAVVDRIRDETADSESQPFLHACILESMRLCPVVVHLARTASADLRIGIYEVRRGQKVVPCTYLAQHNAEVFPEPYAFRPERFLDGRKYEHSYYPFGFGDRTCVGKPFAMRQMALVLSTALRSADLELAPGYRPTPERRMVLITPRGGALMRRRLAGRRCATILPR